MRKIKRKNISITLVSDFKNDVLGAENLIYSIWKNSNIKNINFITTMKNFKETRLYRLANSLKFKLNVFIIDEFYSEVEDDMFFKSLKHISITAFSKILILKYIKENTIYLDTDTLIVGKLKKEKFEKMNSHPIFVVRNGYHSPEYWFDNYENIFTSIEEVSRLAFNSGVIYFNNPQSQKDIFNELVDSIKKNKFIYMDQAHFNFVYKNKAGFMPIEYNFPVHNYLNKNVIKPKKEIILHFASKNKPWLESDRSNPYFLEWDKYNYKKNKFLY